MNGLNEFARSAGVTGPVQGKAAREPYDCKHRAVLLPSAKSGKNPGLNDETAQQACAL